MEAPSWSWAAMSCPIQYRLWHPYERHFEMMRENIDPIAEILTIRSKGVYPSIFPRFRGLLRLRCPVVRAYWLDDTLLIHKFPGHARKEGEGERRDTGKHVSNSLLDVLRSDLSKQRDDSSFHQLTILSDWSVENDGHVYIEDLLSTLPARRRWPNAAVEVDCALICEGGYRSTLRAQYCLVLVDSGEYESYRRIGICVADSTELCLHAPRQPTVSWQCQKTEHCHLDCLGSEREFEVI
jgi:hypothetical protein